MGDVYYWDGAAAAAATSQYLIADDGSPVAASALRAMPVGYRSVKQVETAYPFYMAHRGGSVNWPECSLYAYTRAVEQGCGMLEVSLNRTSDGVWFGLHDQTLDRTSGTVGANPQTMTWAQVQQYQIWAGNTIDPTQRKRPYMRIEELLEAYGKTHVIMFDPKYNAGSSDTNQLIDLMLTYMPASRLVGKYYFTARSFAETVRLRGIKTWGYAYQANIEEVAAYNDVWDWWGMEWSATQETWDRMKAMGKPVIAHICASKAAADAALAKGADGFQVSNVLDVVPRRTGAPVEPPPPAPGSVFFRDAASIPITASNGVRTLTIPATVQDGDLGVLVVQSDNNTQLTLTAPPTGWTELLPAFNAGNMRTWLFTRTKQAGDAEITGMNLTAYNTATAYWFANSTGVGTLGTVGVRGASSTQVSAPSITAALGDFVLTVSGERTVAGPDAVATASWGRVRYLAAGLNDGGANGVTSSAVIDNGATTAAGATLDNTITWHATSTNGWAVQMVLTKA